MSITNYEEVENIAEQLLCFRTETDKLNDSEKEIYIKDFINEYLRDFKNPQENIHEYTDNIIHLYSWRWILHRFRAKTNIGNKRYLV